MYVEVSSRHDRGGRREPLEDGLNTVCCVHLVSFTLLEVVVENKPGHHETLLAAIQTRLALGSDRMVRRGADDSADLGHGAGIAGLLQSEGPGKTPDPTRPRVVEQVAEGASWLGVHYRELERLTDRWQPYVYFRQRPFEGQTIHVDADGRRKTWEPPGKANDSSASRPAIKILMLGGSSLWGFGARDDRTIPRLSARPAQARHSHRGQEPGGDRLCEHARTDRACPELQSGYRPDVVLFYDGVNDTASALLEGRATITTNEINRVREFNMLQSPARLTAALAGS